MDPFRLTIAKPCHEDWNSMTGSEKGRRCASCNKDVVALAEMLPEDAIALVRSAKPHSLCLRIEHDDKGAVIFRQTAAQTSPWPLLILTMSASLLSSACDESTPTAPSPTLEKAASAQSQSVEQVKPSPTDSSSSANEAKSPGTSPPPLPSAAQAGSSAEVNPPLRSPHKANTRVTTGCACVPGDKLCDCL